MAVARSEVTAPGPFSGGFPALRNPLLLVPALIGLSSVGTLLLYFFGVAELSYTVRLVLVPATLLLVALTVWARRTGRDELYDRITAGLWAGAVATLAYDAVRVPIAHSGVPVFRAISYFGTVFLGQTSPTLPSELVGWTYHLSNGIGFGLAYAAVVKRPRWWTAVIWGVTLEFSMLYTPYAEVFGYQRSWTFFSITMGAHVVYGLGLWAALRYWTTGRTLGSSRRQSRLVLATTSALVALGIGGIAADSHARAAPTMPPSPPSYLGKHLYTTWDTMEPDRLAAMWIMQRFVDPQARFYFVRPFSPETGMYVMKGRVSPFGTLFDVPEAEIRRTGMLAATEVLVEKYGLGKDPRLAVMARLGHAAEINPAVLFQDKDVKQAWDVLTTARGIPKVEEAAACAER